MFSTVFSLESKLGNSCRLHRESAVSVLPQTHGLAAKIHTPHLRYPCFVLMITLYDLPKITNWQPYTGDKVSALMLYFRFLCIYSKCCKNFALPNTAHCHFCMSGTDCTLHITTINVTLTLIVLDVPWSSTFFVLTMVHAYQKVTIQNILKIWMKSNILLTKITGMLYLKFFFRFTNDRGIYNVSLLV